ncbi:regulator of nonsense transcripts UPF2 isoform X4 [Prunus dulcis]|uniref:regulator of nonsense transcripts UPF2 isoform X4 n=1 Tax=Prunus dulcis TaxID=3755 RepID=UPI0014836910|nr:regulator of nonsense transcripts UPF2 isoform X4 [Prunus dulcis]
MDHHEEESRAGGEPHGKQDDEEAAARLEEIKKSIEAKMALRQSNLNPERPDTGFLRTLDSSIKRNTAVIKKLKQINEEQREGLMDDLRGVNLSKFVSEAVTAICDAKLRSSDIQAAVQICSLLHQRYKDFSPSLLQGLLKIFFPGKSGDDLDVDKNLRAMKKRSTLKLLLELFFVGVIEDGGIFVNIIKDLTSGEHLKDRDTTQTNLTLLASFARQGRMFINLPLSGPEIHEEFFKGLNITTEHKKFFRKAFQTYYDAAAELLQSEHTSLRQMEHENSKILNAKGELSDENVSSYEKLRKSYEQLYRNVSSLAEALDMQPPVMPEDGHTTRVTSGEDASSPAAGKDSSVLEAIWDDEDTRAFYECLPDLRAFVPAVLLGEAEKSNDQSAKTQEQPTEPTLESDQSQQTTEDAGEASADVGALQEGKSIEKGKDKEEKDKEKIKDPDKEKGDRKGENEKEKLKSIEGTNLDALLQRLPGCVSRDLIDQLTVEFCYLNSKANRKKLVRAVFNVPRTSLELLPYYSRMVATLSTCMKDVSSMLLAMLEEEFNFLINKKDQMNIETKIRNIRFIGELCKFKIAPAGLVFSCLKVLEEIRLGLELNEYGMQQRRIAHMRFLGELYNYEHVDSSVIFETLYLILVFGHGTQEQDVLDPPEDCFRIRMVITLLETCGHYFDRGSSKRKLDRFLMHFQRYILSKGVLPLDVEFDIQDLFAELRPNMTRYSSIDEVNAALVELEEHDRTVSTDKANNEKHSDTEKPSRRATSNKKSVNGTEENGVRHGDHGDSDSDSGSGTIDPDGHDEEELDEENHGDGSDSEEEDDDGGGPASDEDDEVHVRQKVAELDPQEEANFELDLKAVMQESMEQRRLELRGRPALNMTIPMNVFEGSIKDHHGRGVGGESGDEALDEVSGGSKEVQVKVLVKRGNKQQTKQMYIPRDCSLIQSTKQKEAAELEEKQDIKRLVLEYNDREEEELNGLGNQTLNYMQSGGNRVAGRGSNWEGTSGRGGGTRHRYHGYSGGGVYYSRKK